MALLPSFQNYTLWGSSKLLFLSVLSKPMPTHPIWLQPPGKASRKTGGSPTTAVTMGVAPAELCPQPVGCSGAAWFRLLKQQHWIFSPLPSAMGFTTAPQHCHHQRELPPSEEPHPTFLLRAAAFRGLTGVLARTFIHGTPELCSSCCWQQRWPVPMQQRMLGSSAGLAEPRGLAQILSAMGHVAFTGGCRNWSARSTKGKKSFRNCVHISEFIRWVVFAFHPPPWALYALLAFSPNPI